MVVLVVLGALAATLLQEAVKKAVKKALRVVLVRAYDALDMDSVDSVDSVDGCMEPNEVDEFMETDEVKKFMESDEVREFKNRHLSLELMLGNETKQNIVFEEKYFESGELCIIMAPAQLIIEPG